MINAIKRRISSDQAAIGTVELIVLLAMVVVIVVLVGNAISGAVGKKTKEVVDTVEKSSGNFQGNFQSGYGK